MAKVIKTPEEILQKLMDDVKDRAVPNGPAALRAVADAEAYFEAQADAKAAAKKAAKA